MAWKVFVVAVWFWQGKQQFINNNFIKLLGIHELKKMLPSLRGGECLPSPALATPACKLWELENCVCRHGGDHLQFNSLRTSCAREQQDPQKDLLRCLPVSASHFSRCGDLKSHCIPGAHAGRSQDFPASAVTCSTVGPLEADVLPEHQYYRIFGFKLGASSLFSLFHYLCLKGPSKYSCSNG